MIVGAIEAHDGGAAAWQLVARIENPEKYLLNTPALRQSDAHGRVAECGFSRELD